MKPKKRKNENFKKSAETRNFRWCKFALISMCRKFWTFMWTEIKKNLLILKGFYFSNSEKLTFEKENVIFFYLNLFYLIVVNFLEISFYKRSELQVPLTCWKRYAEKCSSEKWSPGQMVPGKNSRRKSGPRKNGPQKNFL